jgi:hypothetical protein
MGHKRGYFKQRFIGGPLDGTERTTLSDEGINDGFWWYKHRVGEVVYTYHREGKQFEDSDYLLVGSEEIPDPAVAYRRREQALRQVVDYVADMGCDDPHDGCECVTCLALEIRNFGCVEYRKAELT